MYSANIYNFYTSIHHTQWPYYLTWIVMSSGYLLKGILHTYISQEFRDLKKAIADPQQCSALYTVKKPTKIVTFSKYT